jgi:hypothetical protein
MKVYLKIFIAITLIFNLLEENNHSYNNSLSTLSTLTTLMSENEISYKESLNKWNELKNDNGNSYTYQTTFLSWAGFGSTTEFKVIDGKITTRIYHEFRTNDKTGERNIIESYKEDEDTLGSHEKGASLLTIDELYSSCASNYLVVDKDKNTIYFKTNINGLMTLCGFVPNGCADDCYVGISIDSFEWIK